MTTGTRTMLAFALLALFAGSSHAYPSLWASSAPSCTALPTTALACHKSPVVDKTTTISVLDGGKPAAKICAGKPYQISITYPNARLAYVTTSPAGGGVLTKTTANVRCPNTLSFDKTNPVAPRSATSSSLVAVAPKGPIWTIAVASATGGCAPYQTATATVKVATC